MSVSAGGIPAFRLPSWVWIIALVFTTPFFYFFLQKSSHPASLTSPENLFLIIYSLLLGLNYCLAIKNRDAIFNSLPSWLVPTWRRILAYVVAAVLAEAAMASLPLPHFYSEVLTRSVIFLLIPYFLVADPARVSGRFLTRTLTSNAAINPALIDSDQEHTFAYNTRRSIFMVLAGSAFVLVGLFMRHAYPVLAWFVICFFGLCLLIGILVLIPGSTCLILNDQGFVMVHLWRRYQYRWMDVCDIEVINLTPETKAVGFNCTEAYRQTSPRWQKRLKRRRWVQEMCGKDALLSPSYNVSPEDLCRVMIQRRVRALSTQISKGQPEG